MPVILDKVDILESMGSRALYESTVNPAGIGYVFVYMGSGDGGSLSSGLLVCIQGAKDQKE